MLQCVAARGYAATTVQDVVAIARVSRNGFYSLFADKIDCFLALADEMSDELLGRLAGLSEAPDWRAALDRGLRLYLAWWRENPAVARAYLVELPFAGPPAVEQRERQTQRFVELLIGVATWARRSRENSEPLSSVSASVLAAGITETVAREVRYGRLEQLDDLHDELMKLTTRVLS